MNWETILHTDDMDIQSCYIASGNKLLGEMVYRLTSFDDNGEELSMVISPHEVINIILQVRSREQTNQMVCVA